MDVKKIIKNKQFFIIAFLFFISWFLNAFIYDTYAFLHFLSTFSLLLFITILINSNKKTLITIGGIFIFLLLIDVFYFVNLGQPINKGVIDSILETYQTEIVSMFFLVFVPVILPSIALTILIIFFFKNKIKKINFNKIIKYIPVGYFIITFSFVQFLMASLNTISKNDFREDPRIKGLFVMYYYPGIVGNIIYLVYAIKENHQYDSSQQIEKYNDAIIDKQPSDNKLVILVMGEASTFSRYSAYGYNKETTPHIKSIFAEENSCIVRNAHSSATLTRDSLSMTLAFHTPESDKNLFNHKSIIEMAKTNGYKTYWLGAQPTRGRFESKFGFIAMKSDVVKLSKNEIDMQLADFLQEVLIEKNDRKFIVVHLHGSHRPYRNYDKQDKLALPEADEYDLTIRYTDRVLNQLYTVVRKNTDDFIMLFTSDHGEDINLGHGVNNTLIEYQIPFLYKSTYSTYDCQFIESFRNNNGYLSGLMNKYILATLLGYKLDQSMVEKEKQYDRVMKGSGEVILFSDVPASK